MNRRIFAPFFWMGLVVVLVGLACSRATGSDATPTALPAPTDVPTRTPAPPTSTPLPTATQPPPPTATQPPPAATLAPLNTQEVEPTEPPEDESQPYYIEEFNGDLSDYSYFVFEGVDGGSEMVYSDGENLVFDIGTQNTWVYFTYDPWIYEDARIGVSVANRGVNSQRVSLVCRLSDDGWFEFNIGGDGLYEIYVYDALQDGFFLIGNGGSTAINLGRDTNVYIAECVGNSLSLYINGEFINAFSVPNDYRFMDEGYVGFAVSSFSAIPVLMEVEWFGIEQP